MERETRSGQHLLWLRFESSETEIDNFELCFFIVALKNQIL